MNTYNTKCLLATELDAIIGGSDSFGKDAGQFIGGAVGTAVELSGWFTALMPSSVTGFLIVVGGLAAASE